MSPALRAAAAAPAPPDPAPPRPVVAPDAVSHAIDVGGHRLHVEVSGEGPPLLLLHGFTGSARSFDALAPALRARRRVVAVDLVGHGRSEAPHAVAAYAFARAVDDLARVLDALRIPRAALLGYSLGGRLALGFACAHPGRVSGAVLIGASAGLAQAEARAARRRDDEALAASIEAHGVEAFVVRWEALPLFASQARLPAPVRAALRAQRLANVPHGLALSLRGMGTGAQPPLHDALARAPMPLLFVAGAEDVKFAAIARELAALAPRGACALVPAAGHAVQLERPADFLALAQPWLARLDPHPIP